VRLSLATTVTVVAVSLAVESAVLSNCEFGCLALRHLALGPGQRGPNQWSMHRPLVGFVRQWLVRLGAGRFRRRLNRLRLGSLSRHVGRILGRRGLEEIDGRLHQLFVDDRGL
jgi:hypothetical protein